MPFASKTSGLVDAASWHDVENRQERQGEDMKDEPEQYHLTEILNAAESRFHFSTASSM